MNEDRLAELMVKVVDGVATPAEREELMAEAVQRPELHRELEEQLAVKAVTDGWMSRLEADLKADDDRKSGLGRAERGLGVGLLLVGFALLVGWVPVELWLDPEVPAAIRGGMTLLSAGSLLLLFHVIRQRFFGAHSDPYDKVIR